MAEAFGVDTGAVRAVREDLAAISRETSAMRSDAAPAASVTGSVEVAEALTRFVDDSTDQRRALVDLVDAVVARLDALLEGTALVDGALTGSLAPAGRAATPVRGAAR